MLLGAGTALGDPIELSAALAVLHYGSTPLQLTTAKSRIGHSEPVAGTVGVTHAATMIAYNSISGVMHLQVFNPMLST
ncbi:hypothetical protein CHLNCDRAFT_27437, partial [Chlorella variabilis]